MKRGWRQALGAGLAGMALLGGLCLAQDAPRPQPAPASNPGEAITVLPAPRPLPGVPAASTPAGCLDKNNAVGLTLVDALRLALLSNLDIAQARAVVQQTLALRQRARVQWLPNLQFGATYIDHQGNIQNTNGNILNVNRDSLFVGGGPTIAFGLSEALYGPGIANRVVQASIAGEQRVSNDTLLAVSDAYLNILRNLRRLDRIDEQMLYLGSERIIPAVGSKGVLPLMRIFVEAGAAARADLSRMEVEVLRRREEGEGILQELRLSMAELARLLRLDPRQLMWPLEDFQGAVPIPGDAWLDCAVEDLVRFALSNRPDLAENRALVEAVVGRLRLAKVRPFLPNFATTYNAGGFGGGPNMETFAGRTFMGKTGRIEHFRHRQDWDASIFWRLNNLGFGNLAEVREQRALFDQANFRALQTADRVVAQVVQAVEFVEFAADRVKILQSGLFDARGRLAGPVYQNVQRNFLRVRSPGRGTARPLEALDAIRSLSDIREAYANALTDYERARFRLLVALGMPARGIVDPRLLPAPQCHKGQAGHAPMQWADTTTVPPAPKKDH